MKALAVRLGHPGAHGDPARDLTRAWFSVGAIPILLLVGFAVGEATTSALGYTAGDTNPLWVSLVVDAVVLVVTLAPCATGAFLGHRARLAGVARAIVPEGIALALGAGIVLLTVVTEIGNALNG